MKEKITIPIYSATLWVVVADNIKRERKKWDYMFGEDDGKWTALCCYTGNGDFGLFFRDNATIEDIAHEVFHCTHRVLDWASVKFDKDNHESAALLNGWLMGKVMEVVKKLKG